MKHRVVTATQFKAQCLALLDEVSEGESTITITKRGKPTATLGPPKRRPFKSSEGSWIGKLHIDDDVLMAETTYAWDALRQKDILD